MKAGIVVSLILLSLFLCTVPCSGADSFDAHLVANLQLALHGIGIQGSFVFGYDWDTPETFDQVCEFTEKTRLDSAFFTILTPFPGTRVYERLEREGRILTTAWERYDMSHAVFRPRCMSPEQLEERYHDLNRRFFSVLSLLRRLPLSRRAQVFGPMNWAFRRGWKRAARTGARLPKSDRAQ